MGHLTANLVVKTNIPVTVPPDVMIAMAAAVHPLSAKHIVPTVIKYMEPFSKRMRLLNTLLVRKLRNRMPNGLKAR